MRLARPTILLLLMLSGVPAAWADGFSRFQDLLTAKGKADMFRFASGSSLGLNGFMLENVVVTPPPDMVNAAKGPVKPMPTRIARVTVEDIDFDSIARDKPPLFVRARLEGVVLDGKAAPDGAMRKYLGTDSALLDLTVDYRLDAARQVFTLTRLNVELRGFARIELALTVDGVTPDVTDTPQQTAGTASLREASLVIQDASLMARLIRAIAAGEGIAAEQQAEMLAQTVLMTVGGDGPLTQSAAHTIAAFLRDWQLPRGPLRITLAPNAKVTFAELGAITKAEEAMKALGLVVTYAGMTVTPPPPPAKLTGAAAIERLIGNTIAATIDGQEVADYLQRDGTWVSKVDSVIARGRWRREGEKVCFKFPDEDENCHRVEIVERKVTMIDDDDNEEHFELFDGNSQNL